MCILHIPLQRSYLNVYGLVVKMNVGIPAYLLDTEINKNKAFMCSIIKRLEYTF